jgi:hypothetical protein
MLRLIGGGRSVMAAAVVEAALAKTIGKTDQPPNSRRVFIRLNN